MEPTAKAKGAEARKPTARVKGAEALEPTAKAKEMETREPTLKAKTKEPAQRLAKETLRAEKVPGGESLRAGKSRARSSEANPGRRHPP